MGKSPVYFRGSHLRGVDTRGQYSTLRHYNSLHLELENDTLVSPTPLLDFVESMDDLFDHFRGPSRTSWKPRFNASSQEDLF